MTGPWDVAIVGAGPAGSAAAIALARLGARVALLERSRFPREKLCGGFVSAEALGVLRRIGLDAPPPAGRFAPIRRYAITTPGGRVAGTELPRAASSVADGAAEPAWGISRFDLDEWLAAAAAGAGARVFEATVALDARPSGTGCPGWTIRASDADPNRTRGAWEIEARHLILCEGRRGRLARSLRHRHERNGRGPGAARRGRLAFQAILDAPAAGADAVELHFFPGGYIGLQPTGGGLVNACGIAPVPEGPSGAHFDALLDRARTGNPWCETRLRGARRASDWRAVGGLHFGAGRPIAGGAGGAGGALLAGDASGTIEPFTGEGIAMALAGGAALAECLRPALEGASGADPDVRWARTWRRAFLPRLLFCPLLSRAAKHPALLEWAVATLARRETLARGLVAFTRTSPRLLFPTR